MLPAEAQEAPAANADSSGDREDPGLAELSLPSSAVKRLAKIAAPGYRFSSESLAGIQRVAQAYIIFATNGALSQVKSDGAAMNKAKKGQKPQPAKKTLQAEHIMRFLTLEMPQLGTKVASLFPDYVPEEFKPESVQLLEKLHLQLRADSIPTTGLSQAEPPETQNPPADSKETVPSNSKRPGEPTEHGGGNSKRQKQQASKTDLASPPKKQERAKAPPAKPRSLTSFFGAAAPRPQEDDAGKVQTGEGPGETQKEQDHVLASQVQMEEGLGETQKEQDVSTARREVDVSKDVGTARQDVDVSEDVSTARRELDVSEEVSTAQRQVDVGKDENDL